MSGWLVAAGAVGAAVGSAVSQGVGVATGLQDKFSWKNVAMAGLSGGIGAGLGLAFPAAGGTLGAVGRGAFLGASGSILTQGIGALVGLQKKFDFAGVAAAGLGGAAGAAAGSQLGGLNRHLASAMSSSASGIVNAATRSLINGTDFGDNLLAALPDVIGSTFGNMIAGAAIGESRTSALRELGMKSRPTLASAELAAPEVNLSALLAALPAADLGTIPQIVVTDGDATNEWLRPAAISYWGDEPDTLGDYLVLAGGARNPRARMGSNGGPPLVDPRTGQTLGIPILNGPLGPIVAPFDIMLDFTGPWNALHDKLLTTESRNIRNELRELDPNWREPASASAPGPESLQSKITRLGRLREERAFVRYRVLGDFGPLQQESLRAYQQLIEDGFAAATSALQAGVLRVPRGMTRAQVIGSSMDRHARDGLRNWYRSHGITESPMSGVEVRVNRRMPTFEQDASYRIPDLKVGNVVFDATMSPKSINTPQVRGYFTNPSTTQVIIVRPRAVGPSYYISGGR
jgi:hypothetical protein